MLKSISGLKLHNYDSVKYMYFKRVTSTKKLYKGAL